MTETEAPKWFDWAREIFSLSQAGITYSGNDYDIQRYKRLQEISAEMLANQSALSKADILQSFSMQTGYATPKIDVRGAVIRDGKILLVRERADGRWAMPGGWGDIGAKCGRRAVSWSAWINWWASMMPIVCSRWSSIMCTS